MIMKLIEENCCFTKYHNFCNKHPRAMHFLLKVGIYNNKEHWYNIFHIIKITTLKCLIIYLSRIFGLLSYFWLV